MNSDTYNRKGLAHSGNPQADVGFRECVPDEVVFPLEHFLDLVERREHVGHSKFVRFLGACKS